MHHISNLKKCTIKAAWQGVIEDPNVTESNDHLLSSNWESSTNVKKVLRLRLSGIQLQTILAKIELTLNSRALIIFNDDINNQVAITPPPYSIHQ